VIVPARDNGRVTDMLDYCADLPVLTFPQGEVLIAEGADPSRLLVLISGSVTVEKDGVAFARIDHPGAVFGEMSWVLDRSATATVRAATPLEVHVMDDPDTFLNDHPGAAVAVLRMTAMRLDGLTQYLVDVKQQFSGLSGHLGMVDQILDSLVHHQSGPTRTGSVRDPEC
jgi:CRP/FNR family cyclic AMP-dependent transcriptional regulator